MRLDLLMRAVAQLREHPLRYRFDDFTLDTDGVLRRDGEEIPLRPQVFSLLATLLEEPGRVLSHDELLDRVWGVEHLSASSLKQTVSELRRALGDSADAPRYVQTVPRRGYRFVASVELDSAEADSAGAAPLPTGGPKTQAWTRGLIALMLVLAGLLIGAGLLQLGREEATTTETAADTSEQTPAARPVLAVLALQSRSDPVLAAQLRRNVRSELAGSGTETSVPPQALAQARSVTETPQALSPEQLLRAVAGPLGADMLVTGNVELRGDLIDAQIVLFDGRTGAPGAYARAQGEKGNLPRLASTLVSELWAWSDELVPESTQAALPPLDLSALEVPDELVTGSLLR